MVYKLQENLSRALPQSQVLITTFAQGPPTLADVELRLTGPSLDELRRLGESVRRILAEHPDMIQTRTTLQAGEPKWWFDVDQDEAARAGFQLVDLSTRLEAEIDGASTVSVIDGVKRVPVRVRLRSVNLAHPQERGAWVPLETLGKFELRPEVSTITRLDGERVNRVLGFSRPGSLPIGIAAEVLEQLKSEGFELPARLSTHRWRRCGESGRSLGKSDALFAADCRADHRHSGAHFS